MAARPNRRLRLRLVVVLARAPGHRALAEGRTALGRLGLPRLLRRRIDGLVQALDPALPLRIADRRHDQQVAGASRRHVGDPHAFRFLSPVLDLLRVEQLLGRETEKPHRAQAVLRPHGPFGAAGEAGRHVGEDDDRELEPLRGVDRHDPYALRVLLDHRRLGAGRAFRLLVQLLNEAAEGAAARELVTAGKIAHPLRVAQHLVAGGPERHRRLGPGFGQHLLHRANDRPVVPAAVEFGEKLQHLDQRAELPGRFAVIPGSPRAPKRVPGAVAGLEQQQQLVVEREQAAPERRVDREIVVRPLHGFQRRPQRLHFFPLVEGTGAEQEMGNAHGLQAPNVLAGRVPVPAQETAEEEADVPRPDPRSRAMSGPVRVRDLDLEAAVLDQPAHELDRGVGLARLDLPVAQVAGTVRPGRRQGDHRGLAGDRFTVLAEGDVVRAAGVMVARHQRREGTVDEPLDRRNRPEAGRQVKDLDASSRRAFP